MLIKSFLNASFVVLILFYQKILEFMNWLNNIKIGTRLNMVMSIFVLVVLISLGLYINSAMKKPNY